MLYIMRYRLQLILEVTENRPRSCMSVSAMQYDYELI